MVEIENCRSYNTIDIGSDHKIVCSRFNVSFLATKRPSNGRCKFNSENLADTVIRETFNLELKNRFNTLFDEAALSTSSVQDQIQSRTDALNNALIESSKTILGKRLRRNQPSWVSSATLQLIEAQEEARKRYKQRPTPVAKKRWRELQKQVSFERDQAAHLDSQIGNLERAAERHEYGTVWKIVGHISTEPNKPVKVLKLDNSTRDRRATSRRMAYLLLNTSQQQERNC